MSTFQYTAKTLSGKRLSGRLQAETEQQARRLLDERRLFPVEVRAVRERAEALGARRVRPHDLGLIYGQLADLLKAGVPMLRALDTLTRGAVRPQMKQLLRRLRDQTAAGKSLSQSCAERPESFPVLHVAMLRAGERGAFLEDVLNSLSGFIERQDELRAKVRGAMIYPLVLLVIGGGLLLVALTVLVPKFRPMFEGVSLPAPTRILFAASDLLLNAWPLVLLFVAAVVAGGVAAMRSAGGRRLWNRVWPRIPVLGTPMRMVAIARFCRILGTMLANGVPILEALRISKDAAGASQLADSIGEAAENVQAGQTLTQPLRRSGLFPAEVLEMIAVAEESNQLENVLVEIADTVERRTNRQVDQAVRLVEPLILVFAAGAIGFVAVGLLYPIFTMAQTMR